MNKAMILHVVLYKPLTWMAYSETLIDQLYSDVLYFLLFILLTDLKIAKTS